MTGNQVRWSLLKTARRAPDCQCGELIDRIAASAPVGKLLFIKALGHTRVPFAGYRPDRAGIEVATIDADRAAEASADLQWSTRRQRAGEILKRSSRWR
jgi:hypothetical protein